MRSLQNKTPWESHDWKVKTVESLSAGGGSKLAFTCRSCERKFNHTTANNRAWATSADETALADDVTTRWLTEDPESAGPMMTVQEVADYLKVHRITIYRLIEAGVYLGRFKVGRVAS